MLNILNQTSIKNKIVGLSVFNVLVLVGIVSVAVLAMNKIKVEIEDVTKQDIPLTKAVTEVTIHQLEQAVNFERALHYGSLMRSAGSVEGYQSPYKKHYNAAKEKFISLAHQVDGEILQAEKLAQKSIENAHNQRAATEFKKVLGVLKEIEKEHADFDKHVEEAFTLLERGNLQKAQSLAYEIEEEEEQLDHELEELLVELEKFTQDSVNIILADEKKAIKLMSVIALVSILVGLLVSVVVVRAVLSPLLKLQGSMEEVSNGNLETEVPPHNARDEFVAMFAALKVFREKLIENKRLEAEQEELKKQTEQARKDAMNKMADDFDARTGNLISRLSESSQTMQGTAQQMSSASEETTQSSSAVAAAAEQANANVQTVAAATEELTSSSAEIARQVADVAQRASMASKEAEETSASVAELEELANSIGDVVSAIKDIADQTNLLALNATIEAARAGEAGKGFAVVADEVKKLATETAQKTEEIDGRVTNIQEAIANSVQAMGRIIENVQKIDGATASVAGAVEEQNAATSEIGRNVSEASTGTSEVSKNIADVQIAATETGQAASTVLASANDLAEVSKNLSQQISGFLSEVRGDHESQTEANDQDVEEQAIAAE